MGGQGKRRGYDTFRSPPQPSDFRDRHAKFVETAAVAGVERAIPDPPGNQPHAKKRRFAYLPPTREQMERYAEECAREE